MEKQESTLGQRRVRKNFNPSANPEVEAAKQKIADLIDELEALRIKYTGDGEAQRTISMAQTDLENTCMQVVKALTI